MKTYFIGLGGCGLQTVAELSKRLSKEPNYENDFAFTYIDTDKYTVESINKNGVIIQSADFIDMGSTNPLAIYREAERSADMDANSKRFMEWIIPQPGHMVLPNRPLNEGAQAQRMVGRTGIYAHYDTVERELTAKINRFSDIQVGRNERRDVDIWVIASSCGGTGSSMVLDILYMVNRIGNGIVDGEPNVKLVLYMPQAFVDRNNTNANHKLNAYSCLSEINYFRCNAEAGRTKTFEQFAVRPVKTGTDPVDFPLYQYLIPVCAENNFGSKMSIEQFYPTIAEMICYLNIGQAKNKVKSLLSNILVEWKEQDKSNITTQMIGYGYRSIKKPNAEFKEYLTRRALYEIIRYGLLDDTEISDFGELVKKFACEAILNNLLTVNTKIYQNGNEYIYDNNVDGYSIESLVSAKFNEKLKNIDPKTVDANVVRARCKQLEDLYNDELFNQVKKDVYGVIKKKIEVALNTFIHEYGLNHAFNLLTNVDDFYLEPLCNDLSNTLPKALEKMSKAKVVCDDFVGSNWLQQKTTRSAEVVQYIKNYKDAVARALIIRLSMDIIKDLTERSTGYLEKLRKGDNMNYAGIRELQKLLETDCSDFADAYDALARDFRATAADVMTVYVPSLAEIATGKNNTNWDPNSIFSIKYQQSILEQQVIEEGRETRMVPVRKSPNSRGLMDILDKIDKNNKIFVDIISGAHINLKTNKHNLIIEKIKTVIDAIVNADETPASKWIKQKLSEAIYDRDLIPLAFERDPEKLFDSFKDANQVPVFFPLRSGIQMPTNMRLLFVGETKDMATSLGYREKNEAEQGFVENTQLADRFLVLRMPAGLSFNMYKYYPVYETFYNSGKINQLVHQMQFGCHIHRAFNEYGLDISQLVEDSSSSEDNFTDQLAKKRIESLVKCLYYQHVVNLLWKTDKSAYKNIFGFNAMESEIDTTGLTPEEMEMLGISSAPVAASEMPEQFITLAFDFDKFNIHLQLRGATLNPATKYIEVDSKSVQNFDFDQEHTQQCKAFVDQLLTIPEHLFKVAEYLAMRFDAQNEKLNMALANVQAEAKQRLLRAKDEKGINRFGMCFLFWKKNSAEGDATYIQAINNVITSL